MKLETGCRKPDACREGSRCTGFTLVEMLVVIVIILVLMGVVFKMTRPSAQKQAEAETVARLERLKAAIEEFYAEYGQYPPVPYYDGKQPTYYEYPLKNGMRSDLVGSFKDQPDAPLFRFGLLSFLLPRYSGRAETGWPSLLDNPQWKNYNSQEGDSERDKNACKRWAPFLDGIVIPSNEDTGERKLGNSAARAYTNSVLTVEDGWERQLVYVSPPPHQSYLLFSKGPDNAYDASDPGNRDRPANKDNIYGDVGFVQR